MQTAPATEANTAHTHSGARITTGKRLATIEQAATVYPFTTAALRDLKFRANDRRNSRGEVIKGNGSGAAGVWVQIGRKVLIDLDAFESWIDSHRVR